MRGHLALPGAAHAIAFFSVRQNHGGLTLVAGGCGVGCMDFYQVMATAFEPVNLIVCHALCKACQFFVLAKKSVAVKPAIFGCKGLHLAINRVGKSLGQCPGDIARKQAVPVAAPHQLDDVPASPCKQFFKFVNDAAVAAYRPVKPLKVAVNDPDHVVEPFTRSKRQGAHGLWLIHLTIAKYPPNFSGGTIQQPPVRQVAHEARVVDRADGAYAH